MQPLTPRHLLSLRKDERDRPKGSCRTSHFALRTPHSARPGPPVQRYVVADSWQSGKRSGRGGRGGRRGGRKTTSMLEWNYQRGGGGLLVGVLPPLCHPHGTLRLAQPRLPAQLSPALSISP